MSPRLAYMYYIPGGFPRVSGDEPVGRVGGRQ